MDTKATPVFRDLVHADKSELQLMGGKASSLAILLQKGFPVPEGAVLFHEPLETQTYDAITTWWENQGAFPVAVRSSASGEDSPDFSYAGQFVTLLHIATKKDLCAAIKTCFQAVHRTASQAYASHFERAEIPMHVLIQRMINSQFSGVFFSMDPRAENSSWLVEVVEGQGEQLVSGQVTPFRFSAGKDSAAPARWKKEYLEQVVHWGQEVEKTFGYKVDMEWAIDQEGRFWILQSRPITAHAAPSSRRKVLDQEWQRVRSSYPQESIWDGHTFAEWTGIPTELTFDIWQRTFQEGQAFDLALKSIGYEGLGHQVPEFSLLDRVYGRAYLNLKSMEPVYFGRSPYRLVPNPRPHLEFDWKKLTPSVMLRAPLGLTKMLQVAWKIQTGRSELAQKALSYVKSPAFSKMDSFALFEQNKNLSLNEQQKKLKELCEAFSKDYLQGTFLITLLIESTTQGLFALLEKDLGKERASETVHLLTGEGLQTVASRMYQELSQIEDSDEKWQSFLSRYGHRGVGELELSHPRWLETTKPHLKKSKSVRALSSEGSKIFDELLPQLSTIRRPVFKQEWQDLQKLMQVREEIKMELMKPYAQIRWLALAIAEKVKLGADIFWFKLDEVLSLRDTQNLESLQALARERKQTAHHLKSVDLPMLFSLQELRDVLDETKSQDNSLVLTGVSLSPGVASGVVHIVNDPDQEDLEAWPDNYVLVTEATDPGWTPLFQRARAVIVARGGVLSHCAIVAREMGLPAVGEIRGASQIFKEGERVWVDGNHGSVRRNN
ncbi:PEP/pyruvate-binding domain-containing protein [Bdellovibrio sp.]|uniref:PEP/pyruvate-binding domain-containing protein n=1 Tax=Bdellovibrio sp. TaxID=28201 RepID=UPI0039E3AE12